MKPFVPPIVTELEEAGLLKGFTCEEFNFEFYSNSDGISHDYLRDWEKYWCLSEEAASKLAAFAEDGAGGLVCLWYYEGLTGSPPVVFAGSEGETGILANNLNEFLLMAAYGYDPWELNDCRRYAEQDRAREVTELVNWLTARFGEPLFTDPFDAVRAARKAHPDYCQWINDNLTA